MSRDVAEQLAKRFLREIRSKWLGQTNKWREDEIVPAWARSMLSVDVPLHVLALALTAALDRLSARIYPPDFGLLLSEALSFGVSVADAENSYLNTLKLIGRNPPAYRLLTPEEWFACRRWPGGSSSLRDVAKSGVLIDRWRELLGQARLQVATGAPLENPAEIFAEPVALLPAPLDRTKNREHLDSLLHAHPWLRLSEESTGKRYSKA